LISEGRITHYVAIKEDITANKLADGELRKCRAVFESSDDSIIVGSLDDTITSWNRGAERIFGYTAAETIGHKVGMLIPPNRANEETEILQRIARGERVEHFNTVRQHMDGRLIDMSITISPFVDEAGAVIGAARIARDMTARPNPQAL
jgi:PAS domain S-box-containing protein